MRLSRDHVSARGASCSFSRTTSTGQVAARATRSAVLPMENRFDPAKPCVAITMRSTSSPLAASMISCVATPVRSMDVVPTAPAVLAESTRPRKASSGLANSCSENSAATGRPPNATGSCGSRTCSSVISEFRTSAMRSAYQRAFLDAGERSVGTRIFLTVIPSCSAVGFGAMVADFMMTFCRHGKNLHDNC